MFSLCTIPQLLELKDDLKKENEELRMHYDLLRKEYQELKQIACYRAVSGRLTDGLMSEVDRIHLMQDTFKKLVSVTLFCIPLAEIIRLYF